MGGSHVDFAINLTSACPARTWPGTNRA